jgi:hypothetical protein
MASSMSAAYLESMEGTRPLDGEWDAGAPGVDACPCGWCSTITCNASLPAPIRQNGIGPFTGLSGHRHKLERSPASPARHTKNEETVQHAHTNCVRYDGCAYTAVRCLCSPEPRKGSTCTKPSPAVLLAQWLEEAQGVLPSDPMQLRSWMMWHNDHTMQ